MRDERCRVGQAYRGLRPQPNMVRSTEACAHAPLFQEVRVPLLCSIPRTTHSSARSLLGRSARRNREEEPVLPLPSWLPSCRPPESPLSDAACMYSSTRRLNETWSRKQKSTHVQCSTGPIRTNSRRKSANSSPLSLRERVRVRARNGRGRSAVFARFLQALTPCPSPKRRGEEPEAAQSLSWFGCFHRPLRHRPAGTRPAVAFAV